MTNIELGPKFPNNDEQAFRNWVADPKNKQSLALPKAAARHLLIPPRLSELTGNPNEIYIIFLNTDPIEYANPDARIPQDINCDSNILRAYIIRHTKNPANNSQFNDSPHFRNLGKRGLIKNTDQITHEIAFAKGGHMGHLHWILYQDIEELRGKGVAKSYYDRLRAAAKELGFTIITGGNNKGNIHFFTDKLGRTPLSGIREELRPEITYNSLSYYFSEKYVTENPGLISVDFLDDEQKRKFVIQQ